MRGALLAFSALLLGCAAIGTETDDGTRPDAVRVMGEIKGYNNDDPRIEIVPGTRSALVRVTTYGGGCHSRGDTEVRVDGMVATVTPYDYTAPPGTVCTQPLISFIHEANISFPSSGTALIRVRGIDRSTRSAQNMIGDTITVERSVEVR